MTADRLMLLALVAVLVGVGWLLTQALTPDAPALGGALLAQLKRPAGARALSAQAHVVAEGTAVYAGTSGPFQLAFHRDGRFARTVDSEIGVDTGFDGRTGWRVDWSGMPQQIVLDELLWERLMVAVPTGQWLSRGSPFTATLERESADEAVYAVGARGSDAFSAELVVDLAAGQPRRLIQRGGRGQETVTFDDHAVFEGVWLPTRVTVSTGGVERARYTVERVRLAGAADYAMPRQRPDDAAFDPDVPARVALGRAATGHLLVKPRVNGVELGWFVFDSGAAVSIISAEAAARLDLDQLGQLPLVSILGTEAAPVYRVDALELGPLTVRRPLFLQMNLAPFSAAFGVEVHGIVGYDVLARSTAAVEVARDALWLYPPGGYAPPGARWEALILDTQHPVVRASFPQARDALFRLDLGSHLGLLFHTPWVERLGLLEGKNVEPVQITPNMRAAVLPVDWLELGGRRFEGVQGFHMLDDVPPLNDRATTGNIGLQLLEKFRVVFDYAKRRIAFVPLE